MAENISKLIISANTEQDKYPKISSQAYHIQDAENQRQGENFARSQNKTNKTLLPIEIQGQELHQTSLQKPCKQEESGVKHLKC